MSSGRAAPARPRLRASAAPIARNDFMVGRPPAGRSSDALPDWPDIRTIAAGGVNDTASLGGSLRANGMDRPEGDGETVPGVDRRDQKGELHQLFIGELCL